MSTLPTPGVYVPPVLTAPCVTKTVSFTNATLPLDSCIFQVSTFIPSKSLLDCSASVAAQQLPVPLGFLYDSSTSKCQAFSFSTTVLNSTEVYLNSPDAGFVALHTGNGGIVDGAAVKDCRAQCLSDVSCFALSYSLVSGCEIVRSVESVGVTMSVFLDEGDCLGKGKAVKLQDYRVGSNLNGNVTTTGTSLGVVGRVTSVTGTVQVKATTSVVPLHSKAAVSNLVNSPVMSSEFNSVMGASIGTGVAILFFAVLGVFLSTRRRGARDLNGDQAS